MKAITTIPPYAPFLDSLAGHKIVDGFRLNTVMPVAEPLEEIVEKLKNIAGSKPLWLDLKCRQLRISRGAYFSAPKNPIKIEVDGITHYLDLSNKKAYGEIRTPPWSLIELDHEVELDTTKPVKCYFQDGADSAYIAKVDGNKLIMLDGPQRVCGGGESINIMDPSLKIKGFFTETDLRYIEAAKKAGVHNYMLSYVECKEDIEEMLKLDPDANIVAKIESEKGLEFVKGDYKAYADRVRLMAARGDLYVEVNRPHKILTALKDIIKADPNAICASRICGSMRNSDVPSCSDISDIGYMIELGYKTCMIGDEICFNEKSLFPALNLLYEITRDYKK